MNQGVSRQRIYSGLLALGACILLYRTITMLAQGSLGILVFWVSVFLIAELLIDASCLAACINWWIKNDHAESYLPLRLGTVAALLHAVRVLIFALGRTERFLNIDVRPDQVEAHSVTWIIRDMVILKEINGYELLLHCKHQDP